MNPVFGAAAGAIGLGLLAYLVEDDATPAAIGALAGGVGGYFAAVKFFPEDFLVHPATGNQPAYAEYTEAGQAKARARLSALTITGGSASSGGATLNMAFPLVQGLPDANAQLQTLFTGQSIAGVALADAGTMNAWLESIAYSSLVISPQGIVLPAPFALLTDSKRGWK